MDKSVVYIHYGSKEFDVNKFKDIINDPEHNFTKPDGGLWASRLLSQEEIISNEFNESICWRTYASQECYRDYDDDDCFTFTLSENSNVLYISKAEDLIGLPIFNERDIHDLINNSYIGSMVYLDFEQLKKNGIDAVEVSISSDHRLYYLLYAWDCDSIIILNKDIIQVEPK